MTDPHERLHAYVRQLRCVGIDPEDGSRKPGHLWTPLVDLALASLTVKPWLDWDPAAFFPARWVSQIAAGPEAAVLPKGTVLRFEEHSRNPGLTGWDSLIWSVLDSPLDVSFLWSADDLMSGPEGVLANHLIVPLEHPLVGDEAVADQLVRDLQAIRLSIDLVAP